MWKSRGKGYCCDCCLLVSRITQNAQECQHQLWSGSSWTKWEKTKNTTFLWESRQAQILKLLLTICHLHSLWDVTPILRLTQSLWIIFKAEFPIWPAVLSRYTELFSILESPPNPYLILKICADRKSKVMQHPISKLLFVITLFYKNRIRQKCWATSSSTTLLWKTDLIYTVSFGDGIYVLGQ